MNIFFCGCGYPIVLIIFMILLAYTMDPKQKSFRYIIIPGIYSTLFVVLLSCGIFHYLIARYSGFIGWVVIIFSGLAFVHIGSFIFGKGWRTSKPYVNIIRIFAILLSLSAYIISSIVKDSPQPKMYVLGLKDKVEQTMNVAAIQQWVNKIKDDKKLHEDIKCNKSHWPKCIKALKPNYVYFENDGTVVLRWWGITFSDGLAVPPTGIDFNCKSYHSLKVKGGGYVWVDGS